MHHTTSIPKTERKKGVMQNGKLCLPNGANNFYWHAICDMDTKLYYTTSPTPNSKVVVKLNTETITQQDQKNNHPKQKKHYWLSRQFWYNILAPNCKHWHSKP